MKIGDIYEKKRCLGMGNMGDGFFKIDDKLVFAKNAVTRKRYDLKIIDVYPNVAFAKLVSLAERVM